MGQRATLVEQIPALVEPDLDRFRATSPMHLLMGDQHGFFEVIHGTKGLHGRSSTRSPSACAPTAP
jgi:hypothetical protein